MALRSLSGMRLSDLTAVEEFLPPRDAPRARFAGGGVGDAVAIKAGQAIPLAKGPILFYAFARCFCHVLTLWL